jgi:hypothetical protein
MTIALFSCLPLALGCQQEEVKQEKTGVVEATRAYLANFGVPPQGKAGRAYATVGYLPVKGKPDKVGPVPIFLFTEEQQLDKVLVKLVSGDLVSSDKQIYYNPFPEDCEVHSGPIQNGVLTLQLAAKGGWEDSAMLAGAMALKETALQFKEVQSVRVIFNGTPMPGMPDGGYQRNPDLMIDVPPPTLILMAGAWESGQELPAELLVEFDRPVKVNTFSLDHSDGQDVEGDYYMSIFQMAVVVHPKTPELYQEGTTLRAEWSVVDDLGRQNSGVDTMQLKKYVH